MIKAGHPQKQAVAAALSTARKYGRYAEGGSTLDELNRAKAEENRKTFQFINRFGAGLNQNAIDQWLANGPSSTEIEDRTRSYWPDSRAHKDFLKRQELQAIKDRRMQEPSGAEDGTLARVLFDPDRYALEEARRTMGVRSMPLPQPNPFRRKQKFAAGGYTQGSPWEERAAARSIVHAGMLKSNVPGRTDKLPITVGGGAFVVPADHLAALGQGNSQAGASILNSMFGLGGNKKGSVVKAMRPTIPKMKMKKIATGGDAGETDAPVDIIAAGGEFVIPPDKVREIGGGDLDKGHSILHRWVLQTRKQHIKTLKGLKPPKT